MLSLAPSEYRTAGDRLMDPGLRRNSGKRGRRQSRQGGYGMERGRLQAPTSRSASEAIST